MAQVRAGCVCHHRSRALGPPPRADGGSRRGQAIETAKRVPLRWPGTCARRGLANPERRATLPPCEPARTLADARCFFLRRCFRGVTLGPVSRETRRLLGSPGRSAPPPWHYFPATSKPTSGRAARLPGREAP